MCSSNVKRLRMFCHTKSIQYLYTCSSAAQTFNPPAFQVTMPGGLNPPGPSSPWLHCPCPRRFPVDDSRTRLSSLPMQLTALSSAGAAEGPTGRFSSVCGRVTAAPGLMWVALFSQCCRSGLLSADGWRHALGGDQAARLQAAPFEAVRFPYSAEALVNLNRFIDGLLGPWLSTSEDANV